MYFTFGSPSSMVDAAMSTGQDMTEIVRFQRRIVRLQTISTIAIAVVATTAFINLLRGK